MARKKVLGGLENGKKRKSSDFMGRVTRKRVARILSSGETLSLPSGEVKGHEPSVLPCVVFDDVLCSYRKSMKVTHMDRCLGCSELARFEHEMDEEEEEFNREMDALYKYGIKPKG